MTRRQQFDIAVIGAGSAGEALISALDGSGMSVVMFEPHLVGGECPFVACMPSKSMLHDAHRSGSWHDAVRRRITVVDGFDDEDHRRRAREHGATIVSAKATIVDEQTVRTTDTEFTVDHIVIATGAKATMPSLGGLHVLGDRLWTSSDALTATIQPARLVIIGGGIIGIELALMYARFGTAVTIVDPEDRPAGNLHERVSELIAVALLSAGVDLRYGMEPAYVDAAGEDDCIVVLKDGSRLPTDRVVVAVGRTPNVANLGLEHLGLDPDDLEIDDSGRIPCAGSVWVMGDAAGRDQYTHVANHHAAVVANHLAGDGSRSFGESVVPACIFTEPPAVVVGPTWSDLEGDEDVVWAMIPLDVPRQQTDVLDEGFLAIAARRSTGTVVAAHGIGPRFDELSHALVIAIDGSVPITTLARTLQPFPTVGEVLGVAFERLERELATVGHLPEDV